MTRWLRCAKFSTRLVTLITRYIDRVNSNSASNKHSTVPDAEINSFIISQDYLDISRSSHTASYHISAIVGSHFDAAFGEVNDASSFDNTPMSVMIAILSCSHFAR
jgi:hypothetical protein